MCSTLRWYGQSGFKEACRCVQTLRSPLKSSGLESDWAPGIAAICWRRPAWQAATGGQHRLFKVPNVCRVLGSSQPNIEAPGPEIGGLILEAPTNSEVFMGILRNIVHLIHLPHPKVFQSLAASSFSGATVDLLNKHISPPTMTLKGFTPCCAA